MLINVTKPQAGEATITCKTDQGVVMEVTHEKDATKADALTDALAAAGKLGVDIVVELPVP